MRCPSWMPAGTSTSSVFVSETRPAPRHSPQGYSTIWPRLRAHELAEETARDLVQATAALAARAGQRLGARLDTVAAAGLACDRDLERHLDLLSARGLDELDRDLRAQVRPALLRSTTRAAAEDVVTEERGEEIVETADVKVRRREPAGAKPGVAVAVVERAPLGAREHLVRLGHLAEADLRLRLVRDVGMQLARKPAKRLLDRGIVGVARDTEQLVVVAVRAHLSSA